MKQASTKTNFPIDEPHFTLVSHAIYASIKLKSQQMSLVIMVCNLVSHAFSALFLIVSIKLLHYFCPVYAGLICKNVYLSVDVPPEPIN